MVVPGPFRPAGRERELFRLGTAWAGASRGRPSLVLLVGDAGVGKTLLADEAVRLVGKTGGSVVRAAAADPGWPALAGDAAEPVLVVLSGLHHARPEAVETLRAVLDRARGAGTGMLVIATVRPTEGEAALAALADAATRLDLHRGP